MDVTACSDCAIEIEKLSADVSEEDDKRVFTMNPRENVAIVKWVMHQ
jgi:hypothetical protein